MLRDEQKINSVSHYAKRDNVNPRKAQRYRTKLNIGKHIDTGATGVWIVTEEEWQVIFKACMDASAKGTKKQ